VLRATDRPPEALPAAAAAASIFSIETPGQKTQSGLGLAQRTMATGAVYLPLGDRNDAEGRAVYLRAPASPSAFLVMAMTCASPSAMRTGSSLDDRSRSSALVTP
jgi:hypothetical protein